jgi:hyperosmotically inducible protein
MLLFLSGQIYADTTGWLTDSEITNKVRAKILMDMSMAKSMVHVESRNHVVILSGAVTSSTQLAKFVELAAATDEVKDVDTTYLTVRGHSELLTDIIITAKVKGLLDRESFSGEKSVPSANIQVQTHDGVVYLTGAVETESEAKNAVGIAASVRDVKSVESTLKIQGA